MKIKYTYIYNGPVLANGRLAVPNYKTKITATSKQEGIKMIKAKFRKEHKLAVNMRIFLPNPLIEIERSF